MAWFKYSLEERRDYLDKVVLPVDSCCLYCNREHIINPCSFIKPISERLFIALDPGQFLESLAARPIYIGQCL